MRTVRILGCGLLMLAGTVSPVRADDPCSGDEEEKSAKAAVAALTKAEQAGRQGCREASPARRLSYLSGIQCGWNADRHGQRRYRPPVGRDERHSNR